MPIKLLPADFSLRISVLDGLDSPLLPDWAASLVWLGAWCRSCQLAGKRLIVFAVLPTRELAVAFAGLGCLVAGASTFQEVLSWPTFRKLPIGREVFWSRKNGTARYRGTIVGFEDIGGAEFIAVNVTKAPRKAEVGSGLKINRMNFDEYRFTEEETPAVARAVALDAASRSLGSLVENMTAKWIWADGAEGLLVTGVATFMSSIDGLTLSIDGQAPIAVSDLLCVGRNGGQSHAKLRMDHHRGALAGNFPLVILDGAKAFMVHEHLAAESNLLVILDRLEYQDGIHDAALELRSISSDISDDDFESAMPNKLAPGVEVAAYLIDV